MKWLRRFLPKQSPVLAAQHQKITPVVGDLPKGEAQWMAENALSPCCHAKILLGPRGGMSQNCWCSACRTRFNVVLDIPGLDWGQITDLNDPRFPE